MPQRRIPGTCRHCYSRWHDVYACPYKPLAACHTCGRVIRMRGDHNRNCTQQTWVSRCPIRPYMRSPKVRLSVTLPATAEVYDIERRNLVRLSEHVTFLSHPFGVIVDYDVEDGCLNYFTAEFTRFRVFFAIRDATNPTVFWIRVKIQTSTDRTIVAKRCDIEWWPAEGPCLDTAYNTVTIIVMDDFAFNVPIAVPNGPGIDDDILRYTPQSGFVIPSSLSPECKEKREFDADLTTVPMQDLLPSREKGREKRRELRARIHEEGSTVDTGNLEEMKNYHKAARMLRYPNRRELWDCDSDELTNSALSTDSEYERRHRSVSQQIAPIDPEGFEQAASLAFQAEYREEFVASTGSANLDSALLARRVRNRQTSDIPQVKSSQTTRNDKKKDRRSNVMRSPTLRIVPFEELFPDEDIPNEINVVNDTDTAIDTPAIERVATEGTNSEEQVDEVTTALVSVPIELPTIVDTPETEVEGPMVVSPNVESPTRQIDIQVESRHRQAFAHREFRVS